MQYAAMDHGSQTQGQLFLIQSVLSSSNIHLLRLVDTGYILVVT
jgi:hypothetical protein